MDPKPSPNNSNHDAVVDQERRGVVGNFSRSIGPSPEPVRVPPGFGNKARGKGYWGSGDVGGRNESLYTRKESVRMGSGERGNNARGNVACELGLPDQLDHPGPPSGSNLHSGLAFGIEEHRGVGRSKVEGVSDSGRGGADVDVVGEQLVDSLLLEDESDDKNNSRQRHSSREKVNTYYFC